MLKQLRVVLVFLAITHFFEAMTAVFVAKKKGENPIICFGKTLFMGVFFLIPLVKK